MIGAIVQARCGSTRLPDKVLRPLLGRPMLEVMLERLRHCGTLDKIVVATTTSPDDDRLESLCQLGEIDSFRGSVDDVLARYCDAARYFGIDVIVRVTSDCPLIDPDLVDEVVDLYVNNRDKYDYCSNIHPPTFPDGLDVEVFPITTLERLSELSEDPSDREHVTTYLDRHPDDFRIGNLSDGINRSKFRWTVDTIDDFKFVTEVYTALYKPGAIFKREDVFELLRQHPQLMAINAGHARNEGHEMTAANKKAKASVR